MASTMDSLFGNTLVATAAGAAYKYHFEPDGHFKLFAPDGAEMGGDWRLEGSVLVLSVHGAPETRAELASGKTVGDTWGGKGPDGSDVSLSIAAGRQ